MKNSIFIAVFALTLLSSCKETSKNDNAEMADTNSKIENKAEMKRKQDSIVAVKEENRMLDSIQQMKSHGHAH